MMMKRYLIPLLTVTIAIILSTCSSVPVTGRKQIMLVSDSEVLSLSNQQYAEFIKTAPASTNKAETAVVQKVGRNIANAVETWMKQNGYESELANYSWEFNLIKSDEVNAFCMPGGKIVVYEGILPITRDETGLAVVLGHEVAHAVAKHANERMSQQMVTEYGSSILGTAISSQSSTVQQAASIAFGLGTQYGVLLPYSRKQELEADELGLIFMSMAGYDPRQAPAFWERMSQAGNAGVPEFMSTHPSDKTRIEKIQEALPTALKYYQGAGVSTSTSSGHKNAATSKDWTF